MHRTTTPLILIVTVMVLAARIVAQQAPSHTGPRLQSNPEFEGAAAKQVVDGIMQPYLA
jgi:hypothetical protein